VTASVNNGVYTAATAGTAENPGGTDGGYTFTVTVRKDAGTPRTTIVLTLLITAAPYVPPEAPTITVTFDANGGDVSPAFARTEADGKLNGLPAPRRDGYIFEGWFTQAVGGVAVTLSRVYTADTVLYAHWTALGGGKTPETGGNKGSTPADGSIALSNPDDPLSGADPVNPFTDVAASDWFHDDVMWAYARGYMRGTSETLFRPGLPLTRAMFVTILYRSVDSPDIAGGSPVFTDTPDGAYYRDAVAWAAEHGIVLGVGGNRFAPDREITREEAATILLRFARHLGKGPEGAWAARLDFADAGDISDWAVEGAMWCADNGIIRGRPQKHFAPQASATRAEAAVILRRFTENLLQSDET
jgi:uncharacterized repeat protein (TIGR02543 family)